MKTILYVEDDEHDIFFLKRAFASQAPDLQIQQMAEVSGAIEYLKGQGPFADREQFPLPDLVISDVSIPGGSGFQLLAWIRSEPAFRNLPVILMSGSAQPAEISKASTSGADYCLEKSTDFEQLLAKVRRLLQPEYKRN